MVKGEMVKRETNGTVRTISIIAGLLLAACGIVWGFANQSFNLDQAVVDVAAVEAESEKTKSRVIVIENAITNIAKIVSEGVVTKERVDKVEDAVILIQSDINYIQRDIEKIAENMVGE